MISIKIFFIAIFVLTVVIGFLLQRVYAKRHINRWNDNMIDSLTHEIKVLKEETRILTNNRDSLKNRLNAIYGVYGSDIKVEKTLEKDNEYKEVITLLKVKNKEINELNRYHDNMQRERDDFRKKYYDINKKFCELKRSNRQIKYLLNNMHGKRKNGKQQDRYTRYDNRIFYLGNSIELIFPDYKGYGFDDVLCVDIKYDGIFCNFQVTVQFITTCESFIIFNDGLPEIKEKEKKDE